MGPAAGRWLQHQRVADSAVVGSIIAWTSEIRFAGKPPLPGVFTNQFLIGRDVNAMNPIVHYVAFDPLNLWSKIAQHSAGFLRDSLELFAR